MQGAAGVIRSAASMAANMQPRGEGIVLPMM